MELTKEAVNRCISVGALREFLCQAMDQIDEKDKEIARQKRKRCLAMAKWCQALTAHFQYLGNYKRRDRFRKWMFRFYNIADKFKEA